MKMNVAGESVIQTYYNMQKFKISGHGAQKK